MATLDELKGKVDHMSDVMDVLASNYTKLTTLVEGHGEQLAELRSISATARKQLGKHDEQMAELRSISATARKQLGKHEDQMAELRHQTAELRQMSANAQKQLENSQQQLLELRRDGQKTRRLWIAVAQKLDWLDLDEDFD